MVSLSNLLNEVFRENFQVRHISAEAVVCLFFEMKGTLLKLLGSIEDPYRREAASRKILALQPGPSAERWFQAITEILEGFLPFWQKSGSKKRAARSRRSAAMWRSTSASLS